MRADLHLHSHYSDGSASPTAVVERACAANLDLIALTDHDSIGGLSEAQAAADKNGIQLLAAAEFTAQLSGKEIHLLGYFPAAPGREVLRHLEEMQAFRRRRLEIAMERLRQRGLQVDFEDLPRADCCQSVTTAHLTRLLVERGYAASGHAARRRFLTPNRALVPAFEAEPGEVINVIHAGGGLAVWAHPERKRFTDRLEELIVLGLDGVEAANWRRGREGTRRWLALANKMNLVTTGGSDWHGTGPLGEFAADETLLEVFLRRLPVRRASAPESPH